MLARSLGPYEGIPEAGISDNQTTQDQITAFRLYIASGQADVPALAALVSPTGEDG